jgi:DNA polymerase (family 10)
MGGASAPSISNPEVVRALERIAGLLEIRGDNAFKVRAYRTAAQQVENLAEPLGDIAERGELTDLPGFGEAIATKVDELVRSGRLAYLEALEAEVPPSLLEVRALHGVGPRTAAMLWHELGVTTVDALDAAAQTGRLEGLPRLGPKSIENLLGALETRRASGGAERRRLRAHLEGLVDTVLGGLRALPGAERAEVAGSFRRGRDTSGDLDFLVATRTPVAALAGFATLAPVEKVLLRGDTKCSVHVDGGFQLDCRAVAPEEFGAAWQYFTGSQAHNVRLRGVALRLGLTLNEYGVYRVEGGGRVAGETEEDVYRSLGLSWIPPDEREGRGELEAHSLTTSAAEA